MKKTQIIEVALELFMEKGYEKTKITDIMRKVNLSKGGMYHHFSSKEEILESVIYHGLGEETNKLTVLIEDLPADKKIIAFAKGMEVSKFTQSLLEYEDSNKDSLVAYKIREANIYLCIPLLTEILRAGVKEGIYHTDFPKEIAEYLVLIVRSIVDGQTLPKEDDEAKLKRIKAFLDLIDRCLNPSKAHLKEIENVFFSDQHIDIESSKSEVSRYE